MAAASQTPLRIESRNAFVARPPPIPRHVANDVTRGEQPRASERAVLASTTRTQPIAAMNQTGAANVSARSDLTATDSSHPTGMKLNDEVRPNRTTG